MPQSTIQPLWGSLALDRDSLTTLQDQIVQFFRDLIEDGRMHAGQRVPSSRQLADECGVSRTTAVEVYQRLVAEGYFTTRPGSGVFVAEPQPGNFRPAIRSAALPAQPPPDLARIDMRHYHLPLAPGMPAIDRFPWSTWARLTSQICRARPLNAVGYGDPQGELSLRETIAEYLGTTRGMICDASQIVVMAGSAQTLEFMLRQVAVAGDNVWVEEPCGAYMRHISRKAGLVPISIDVDQEGLDVEQGLRKAPAARIAIVSPTHQDPTGATMSLARRQALVDWCEAADGWVFENEIDGDYRYSPRPLAPVYTLSREQRVFYCGSLSKPFAPGLRTNYVVVPRAVMSRLALTATLVPMLTQLVLARFNAAGHLAVHMRRMRTLYARRRTVLLEAMRSQITEFLDVPRIPEGGLRVTATMKYDMDDVDISRQCLAAGIKLDPLSSCYAGNSRSGLIIGFASTPEESIPASVATLASVFRRELDLLA